MRLGSGGGCDMRIGSLFSGIGGLELGLEWAGLGEVVWQVEQSGFCRRVLAKHWPDAERFEDARTVGASTLAPVDLICGGFPCQDISSAGKGAGLAGERSGLWFEFARVLDEMRPEWVVIENVASGAQRWVDAVRAHLEQLGYETLPIPLSAADVGADHERERVFIVAYAIEKRRAEHGGARAVSQELAAGKRTRDDAGLAADRGRPRKLPLHNPWGACVDVLLPAYRGVGARTIALPVAGEWSAGPVPLRVAHGVSRGLDDPGAVPDEPLRVARIQALGNAVVPQCAEVVGWVIRELIEGAE